jgi:hypothetical protein
MDVARPVNIAYSARALVNSPAVAPGKNAVVNIPPPPEATGSFVVSTPKLTDGTTL